MHFLCHLEPELELALEFELVLELELPLRVANAEWLAGVAEGADCCMRYCSLNSSIRSMMDGAALFFRSFRIRLASIAPA